MNLQNRILVAVFAVGVTLVNPATTAAQSDRFQEAYWYCHSVPNQDPIYMTGVWDARAIPYNVYGEFRKWLAAKYKYDGIVICSIAAKSSAQNTLASQQKSQAQQIANWQKDGKKVVQVAWTSNEKPVGPPPIQWSACGAMILAKGGVPNNGPFETYVSAPFDAGKASVQEQQEAFAASLRTKYPITTTDLHPQCLLQADEAGAQKAVKFWMERGKLWKVIETGWKLGGK